MLCCVVVDSSHSINSPLVLKNEIAAYLRNNLPKFRGSEDYIEKMLLLMGKETFAKHYNVFVDVGAASYGEHGGDLALSFIYDIAFPSHKKTVMAFEPFKMKHDQLLEMLQVHKEKYKRDDSSLNYILKNIGVGMSNQTMTFRGKRSVMTANKRIMLHPWYLESPR